MMNLMLVFLVIFTGTMTLINRGYDQTQVLVANTISAVVGVLIMFDMMIKARTDFEKTLNKSPWLSGWLCGAGLFLIIFSFNPARYTEFTDYTLTIFVIPVLALLSLFCASSRIKYLEANLKRRKELEKKKQTQTL